MVMLINKDANVLKSQVLSLTINALTAPSLLTMMVPTIIIMVVNAYTLINGNGMTELIQVIVTVTLSLK
jgi:hypothetical protein